MSLSDEYNLGDLYEWLDEIPLSRPKRHLYRDFSDGVLMAELLKHFYPRLVELHNYAPANGQAAKLNNWLTINRKVLTKLNLGLHIDSLRELSQGKPGIIDHLLLTVKNSISRRHDIYLRDTSQEGQQRDNDAAGDDLAVPHQKGVPHHILHKMKSQMEEKDEVIKVLNQKVTHLESMLQMKDNRIKDLLAQINHYQTMDRNILANENVKN